MKWELVPSRVHPSKTNANLSGRSSLIFFSTKRVASCIAFIKVSIEMGDKFEYCLVKGFSTVENGRPSLMIQSSQENIFFIFGGIEGRKNPYESVK